MKNNYILIGNADINYYFDKNEIVFLKYNNGILTIKLKNSSIVENISFDRQQWNELLNILLNNNVTTIDY